MKKIFVAATLLALAGCNSEDSSNYNPSSSSYSSCRIIKSEALLASERTQDLKQCWNALGGYYSKSSALSWCEREVTDYMRRNYSHTHSVTLQVSTSNCP